MISNKVVFGFGEEYDALLNEAYDRFDGLGVDHSNRFRVFFDNAVNGKKEDISDKLYWVALRNAYEGTDNLGAVPRNILRGMFQFNRPHREYLMNPNERDFLGSLPDRLTIYRGMTVAESKSKDFGISWTLSEETANFFAFTYQRNHAVQHLPKCVESLDVSKAEIVAYFNDRQEQEVIYLDVK